MIPLTAFPPVALDDLVAEAELLARVDRKYLLSPAAARELVAGLDPRTRMLQIGREARFSYESIYFDTPDLLSYRMAARSRRLRFKVRTRAYLDTDTAYLEVKSRGQRGLTVKERVDHDSADRARLTDRGRQHAASALTSLGLDAERVDELVPVLTTRYRRTTLVPPGAGIRLTIDTDLRWEGTGGRRIALPNLVIVETKSGSQASAADRALWRAGHRPQTVSKYGTGMAALDPRLPANKWARALRTHFAPERNASCVAA